MVTSVLARGILLLVPLTLVLPGRFAAAEELTLSQVLDLSFRNNGELASFREEQGVREAGLLRAELPPNPVLDFEAATGALTGSSDESSLALGISREFLLGGKREKRRSAAERELDVYRWQVADRERVLRAEITTAFLDAVLAAKRVDLADRAIELNRQLLDVTRERLAAGDIPELEMNLVKVELARSEGSRIEAATVLNQSRAKLWTLAGLPLAESPAVAGDVDPGAAVGRPLADLKRLASANRPDLKALEAETRKGEAEIVLAEAEGVPNLTAGVAVKRDTTSMEIGGLEGKETAYTIGLKLSMPIPLFDKNQAGVQEARARRSSTASRLAAAGRAVEREVESAWAAYLNSEKVLSLYKSEILPQLEENLKLTEEAYRLGEVGILSVIQEQKKFFEVSDGYLTAFHARQTALAKLEAATATTLSGGAQ